MYEPSATVVFHAPTRKPCLERALVLQALGIPHSIAQAPGGMAQAPGVFQLLVGFEHAESALRELARYDEENVDWPPVYDSPPLRSQGRAGALAYVLLLIAFYPIGKHGFLGHNFWDAGRMQAGSVLGGEWWRTITALTLHADLAHLSGNLVFGACFAVLAGHSLGAGLTWLAVVLSGAIGNYVNSLAQPASHSAIGASTAVFGAIGIAAAYEWMRRHVLRFPPLRRMAPLLGGAVLLGFLGMSGENTDVVAHCTGLFAGLLLGMLIAGLGLPERLNTRGQFAAGVIALLLLALAWACALA